MKFVRLCVLVLLAAVGCAESLESDTAIELPDYSATGPFTAATLEDATTGSTGVDLTLQIWYPSLETQGEPVRYDGLWLGEAIDGLDADCTEPRPVMVFSHGYGGVRWQSTFLTEHLATHGYLIIAPDHTYNTFRDDTSSEFIHVVTRRPLDVSDSFDWLVAQSEDPESPLAGCVDDSAGFAVSGHSFGGYTTYAIAGAQVNDPVSPALLDLSDDRAWAALALAPWDVDGTITTETMSSLVGPVMTLSGTRDENTTWSQVSSLHAGIQVEPRYLGEFPDAGHSSFSPLACMLFANEDGCGEDYIDLESFTQLVRTAGLAFFESARGVEGAMDQLPVDSSDLVWEIAR